MDWFGGLRVLSLESRRADEMATLIGKYGGRADVAPSLREYRLDTSADLERFEAALLAGNLHAVVCMTGVGTKLFLKDLFARDPRHLDRVRAVPLIARGSKPQQALKALGLRGEMVPRPHTWREVQEQLLGALTPGQRVAILEYGDDTPSAMVRELEAHGLHTTCVPVYRCAFPADVAPLTAAVHATVRQERDILLLSSGTQVLHFIKHAQCLGLEAELRAALKRMVVASIGPACTEAAAELNVRIDLEANPHKMGILVRAAAEYSVAQRRRSAPHATACG